MNKIYQIFCALLFIASFNFSQGWFPQSSGTINTLIAVHFIDEFTGYAVGDSAFSYHVILKTTNGGTNWLRISQPYPNNAFSLKSVYFLNSSTGWACGMEAPYARVFKTTNGGANWSVIVPEGSGVHSLRSIWFINGSTGIAVGSAYTTAGWIFRSTNGGINWTQQSGAGNILHSVYFVDAATGFACGEPGTIIKTTNAGLNWTSQTIATSTILRAIHFINPSTGWVAGSDSRVYRTTNGGANWAHFYNQTLCGLFDIYFANDQTGWVCGCEGAINGTKNGGNNWTLQSFGGTTYLYSMSFVSPTTGWAVGAGGRILKTTTGGVTAIETISNEVPEEFSLSQNYPNPFNPNTIIKFTIPLSRGVDAEGGRGVLFVIFDILGREVTTLVNQRLRPGTYEVTWDATDFPSGVYYYRLSANDYSETRKMILVK